MVQNILFEIMKGGKEDSDYSTDLEGFYAVSGTAKVRVIDRDIPDA